MESVNTALEQHGQQLSMLDKPNVYRIIELVVHTIPKYGHALHISDLVFEHNHKNVKNMYRRGNSDGNSIWVVQMNLINDWLDKVAMREWFKRTERSQAGNLQVRLYEEVLTSCLFKFAPALVGQRSDHTRARPSFIAFAAQKKDLLLVSFVRQDLNYRACIGMRHPYSRCGSGPVPKAFR